MENSTPITIQLASQELMMLRELAGDERSEEYLIRMIRHLHNQQEASNQIEIEIINEDMDALEEKRNSLKQRLSTVEKNLEDLAALKDELTRRPKKVFRFKKNLAANLSTNLQ